jgi:mannosylglycerate hydrolase
MATDGVPRTVAIVPHTHWDREWYAPFQEFRVQLVTLLDRLLPLLERDLSYARFLLDGQTAVIDDYLEIRPEAAATLQRLAAAGRVSVGPWMILMDEFMVSGETIVRDLQAGMARATELGGAMPVGYLPDMFGHIAQMPQILRQAGLGHAVVWRGVPTDITQTAFWWVAPDGSRVRAEYLYGSYSNGRDLPDDAKQLVARARSYELELGPAALPGGAMLLMNGTDHQIPQPWLGRVVAEANDIQDDYRFVVSSLAEHVTGQPTDGISTWTGELRSGARANVLMGVASNRVDVHQACATAERALERRAEPLCALLLGTEAYPHALLDVAWRNLILNSAHDSSCACSDDEVVDHVLVRYREARQIGDSLTREALHALAAAVDAPASSTVVANPTAAARGGLVRGFVPGEGPVHFVADDGTPCPTQVIGTIGGDGFTATVEGAKVRWVLDMMRGPELAGTRVAGYERAERDDGVVEFVFRGARQGEDTIELDPVRDEVLALGEQGATVRFRVSLPTARDVLFAADPVPAFGWRTYRPVDGEGPATALTAGPDAEGTVALANEHLTVAVDGATGTFTIDTADGVHLPGLGRLVDGGDGGDTYNYSPPAEEDLVVEHAEAVTVTTLETGPVRARVAIDATYRWSTHAIGDAVACSRRSDEVADVVVRTTLELRHDERFLRVRNELDNVCRDHRLRAHFPLPTAVTGSEAECAFAVVHRGLTAEGGPGEVGLPTFVSRRFVTAGGLAVLHDGLLEYEVVGDGSELALTLLRAVGYLSRIALPLRPDPAGPPMPVEGAQMRGPQVFDYALLPHQSTADDGFADLYRAADDFLVPLERARGGGVAGASLPPTGQALAVRGAQVSTVRREPGGLVVRVFNPSHGPASAEVERDAAPATGWVVDLVGRPLERFEGTVALRPGQLATLRLD